MESSSHEVSRRSFLNRFGLAAAGVAAANTAFSATEHAAGTFPHSVPALVRAKRALMISLDGICVEGFQKAHAPHLRELMSEGAFSLDTRVVMPSITLPNWTSHLTGSGPEQHGVFDNNWTPAKSAYPAVRKDGDGYYPSVFQVLKESNPSCKTAFYYNWKPLSYPFNEKYLDETEFLKNDAYAFNYEQAFRFMKKHRNAPAAVFLYSVHTDHAGHRHGWMSPEYLQAIEEADQQIGILFQKLKQEGLYRDTHFLFLTDHGGIGKGHGGTSAAEMIVPWGIAGPGIKRNFQISEPNNTTNTAPMLLHLFGGTPRPEWTGKVIESVFLQ
ncbi:alkaline phosphatase family protein [Akkermansia muciniphila]|uniref:alkaline phosphatase family protein n=1 Tax=Akkermansia muciniphila TaxID=239935 RepID=UPI0033A3386C